MTLSSASSVSYSDGYTATRYFMIEGDEEVVDQMKKGNVYLKGDLKDQAILTTEDKTYSLTFHDNSNLQYICRTEEELVDDFEAMMTDNDEPPSTSTLVTNNQSTPSPNQINQSTSIMGVVSSVIKLQRIFQPTIDAGLVERFSGPDQLNFLEYHIQASSEEIANRLKSDSSILYNNGTFNKIEESFRVFTVDQILNILNCMPMTKRGFEIEEIWAMLTEVLGDECNLSIEGVRSLMRCLQNPACKADTTGKTDNEPMLETPMKGPPGRSERSSAVRTGSRRESLSLRESLEGSGRADRYIKCDAEAIKKFRIKQLLSNGDGLNLDIFAAEWRRLVSQSPLCEEASSLTEEISSKDQRQKDIIEILALTQGSVVTEELSNGHIVLKICEIAYLSSQPRDRLKQLFQIKKHWKREELSVYLSPLFPEGTNIDSFLLKSSRNLTVKAHDGSEIRVYTSLF